MPITVPVVWPDSPLYSIPNPTTPYPTKQHIYNRPNSEFNRLTSNRVLSHDDFIDRPEKLTNSYSEPTATTFAETYRRPTSTVPPAINAEDRHGHLKRRRKRPCIPVAKPKPHRYRDAQGRQMQQGKTLWDLNLYYLNLGPSPYSDVNQNDSPVYDDDKPTYDAYGGYDCIPSYEYYGDSGGGGGHFQHFQNHQHFNHHNNHNNHNNHNHNNHHGQVDHDDIDTQGGGSPPSHFGGNRPSGGPFGFFGQGGLFDISNFVGRPPIGGSGGALNDETGAPVRPVIEINVQDVISNLVRIR